MKRGRGQQGAQAGDKQPSITSFFTAAASRKPPAAAAKDTGDPQPKRRKQAAADPECIVIDSGDEDEAAAPAAAAAVEAGEEDAAQHEIAPNAAAVAQPQHQPHPQQPAAPPPPPIPSQRNAAAHGAAQAKLVAHRAASGTGDAGGGGGVGDGNASSSRQQSGRRQPAPKYTPLEQQVIALKAQHPGVLLVVEVGYKMCMYGEDAEVAASVLGIYCFPGHHNFKTASFPVQRLPIHVRRLVAAGHKVGVVRQTESAALKAAGDNKSAPFSRSLTGLFTAATLEAAEKADKLDEAAFMEVSQELESMLGGSGRSATASYILVISQAAGAGAGDGGGGGGLLGLLAVDAGSGDIAYGLGSTDSSSYTPQAAAGGTSGTAAASVDNDDSSGSRGSGSSMRDVLPLETVLLSLMPAEIVVCEPVSAATEQLLKSYIAGASRRCRLERIAASTGRQRAGGSSMAAAAAAAAGGSGAGARGYLSAALMNDLVDFFSDGSDASPGAAAAAATAASAGGQDSAAASLQFILSLPQPVLSAIAGALAYLKPFGLAGVLRCTSSYRRLAVGGSMILEGSALRQLELLEAGADSSPQLRGSLLHLLDRCSTAAGGRMLRRWCHTPLADRAAILDRQQAVQVLLDSITGSNDSQQQGVGGSSGSSSTSSQVLQALPKWLSSTRQDLERALARVAAGSAAPTEAVGLWTRLAELPSALHLPTKQQQQPEAASTEAAAAAAAAGGSPPAQEGASQVLLVLDTERLSRAVPSRLLVSLLATAGSDVSAAAAEVLGRIDAAAAAKNDFLSLFTSQEHFPQVFACKAAVTAAEQHLQNLLPQLASTAGVARLQYVSVQNQGNYLLELPAARTEVPRGWEKVCATKKVCRYHPAEVKTGMAALARAQEQLQAACASAWSQLLRDFTAAHHTAFRAAVAAVAQLDALYALAVVASSPGYCRPQFVDEAEPQQLDIQEGKHPQLDLALDGTAVANSLHLSWDGTRAAVITGPNMGGKSVLIRQAAVTVIMAQLGSWVPASSCTLSVFDRVCCRMGASDSLMLGRSTFAEELGEASHILAHATNRSLVIMDELGRGTATHDGVAIACATLSHLVSHIQCLSLFVTHYPEVATLATPAAAAATAQRPAAAEGDAAAETGGVGGTSSSRSGVGADSQAVSAHTAVYHMSYVRQDAAPPNPAAEQAAAASGSGGDVFPPNSAAAASAATSGGPEHSPAAAAAEAIPVITFLYRLTEGAADESFGLNVAQMAGLPVSVVQRAAVLARQLKHRLAGEQQQQRSAPSVDVVQLVQRVRQALRQLQAQAAGTDSSSEHLVQLQELCRAAALGGPLLCSCTD